LLLDAESKTKTGESFDFVLDGTANNAAGFAETGRLEPEPELEPDFPDNGLPEFDLPEFGLPTLILKAANLGELKISFSRSLPLFDLDREIIERITSSFRISCQPGTISSLAIDPSCLAVKILSSADVAMLYSKFFCSKKLKVEITPIRKG
jgi:hypothetical protein